MDLRVSTFREPSDLRGLRGTWQSLQDHPWSDHHYYTELLAARPEYVRPHIMAVERGGSVVSLLVGRILEEDVPWRVGNRRVMRSHARVLFVGSGGLMGESSPEVAQRLVRELVETLERGEADVAYLHKLEQGSAFLEATQAVPGLWSRDRFGRQVPCWILDLPDGYEAYLRSRTKATRKHLKRDARRIERELPGTRMVCLREPADLERILRDSEAVARNTYQRRIGVGFHHDAKTREFLQWALAVGWMRAHILYMEERPIAFSHDLHYAGTLFMGDTGYEAEFQQYRPGIHLLSQVIAAACGSSETRRLDFGTMDADYKRSLGNRRVSLVSTYVFSRRPKGLELAIKRSVTGATDRLARRVLGTQRARRWSRRLKGGA